MKKVCVFLMFILVVYGIFPAYATTDIAADAESSECVEDITGTYSGDANFKAKWRSNVIQLNWYNNNTLMQGVNTESNTCNYGTTLTIPTNPPSKTGYIFDGWKVRPTMDFSTLTSLPNGQKRWAKGNYCWYAAGTASDTQVSCKSDIEFKELEKYEWKVQFSSGTMYGSAHCSAKSGNSSSSTWPANNSSNWLATYDQLESTIGEKRYCWCQATGWKPSTNNPDGTIYGQSSVSASSAWVFERDRSLLVSCNWYCTNNCMERALNSSAFRRALVSMQ